MKKYVAFLRAVNVGGTGKIAMSELKNICDELGFLSVKTYIASGNVLFKSNLEADEVKQLLEAKLEEYFGKYCETYIKTSSELVDIIDENPFKDHKPNRVICYFLNQMPNDALLGVKNQKDEEIIKTKSAIFIHYGDGMAATKLQTPWLKSATGRNINTISKICELLQQI